MAGKKKRPTGPVERKASSKPTPRRRPVKRAQWPYWVGGAGLVVVAIAIAIAVLASTPGAKHPASALVSPPSPGAPIDGIKCETEMVQFHFHAHLALLQDGSQVSLPAGIGINQEAQCLYWLHTHQTDGIIHIEAPGSATFTLGQFFDIWGQPLSATQAGPLSAPAGQTLHFYVNRIAYTGDPRSIELQPHQVLVIEAGVNVPPPGYTFPAGY